MDVQEVLSQARDAMTVKKVFGDPIERNGVTLVPVANVSGGAGAGAGTQDSGGDGSGSGAGGGGGFGVRTTPAGVYVIDGQNVSWQPAVNVNRAILGGQIAFVVLLLVIRSIVRIRHQ